ncbi:hypothetical protein ADUPG1_006463, partial [Aduncisulcus paluster]
MTHAQSGKTRYSYILDLPYKKCPNCRKEFYVAEIQGDYPTETFRVLSIEDLDHLPYKKCPNCRKEFYVAEIQGDYPTETFRVLSIEDLDHVYVETKKGGFRKESVDLTPFLHKDSTVDNIRNCHYSIQCTNPICLRTIVPWKDIDLPGAWHCGDDDSPCQGYLRLKETHADGSMLYQPLLLFPESHTVLVGLPLLDKDEDISFYSSICVPLPSTPPPSTPLCSFEGELSAEDGDLDTITSSNLFNEEMDNFIYFSHDKNSIMYSITAVMFEQSIILGGIPSVPVQWAPDGDIHYPSSLIPFYFLDSIDACMECIVNVDQLPSAEEEEEESEEMLDKAQNYLRVALSRKSPCVAASLRDLLSPQKHASHLKAVMMAHVKKELARLSAAMAELASVSVDDPTDAIAGIKQICRARGLSISTHLSLIGELDSTYKDIDVQSSVISRHRFLFCMEQIYSVIQGLLGPFDIGDIRYPFRCSPSGDRSFCVSLPSRDSVPVEYGPIAESSLQRVVRCGKALHPSFSGISMRKSLIKDGKQVCLPPLDNEMLKSDNVYDMLFEQLCAFSHGTPIGADVDISRFAFMNSNFMWVSAVLRRVFNVPFIRSYHPYTMFSVKVVVDGKARRCSVMDLIDLLFHEEDVKVGSRGSVVRSFRGMKTFASRQGKVGRKQSCWRSDLGVPCFLPDHLFQHCHFSFESQSGVSKYEMALASDVQPSSSLPEFSMTFEKHNEKVDFAINITRDSEVLEVVREGSVDWPCAIPQNGMISDPYGCGEEFGADGGWDDDDMGAFCGEEGTLLRDSPLSHSEESFITIARVIPPNQIRVPPLLPHTKGSPAFHPLPRPCTSRPLTLSEKGKKLLGKRLKTFRNQVEKPKRSSCGVLSIHTDGISTRTLFGFPSRSSPYSSLSSSLAPTSSSTPSSSPLAPPLISSPVMCVGLDPGISSLLVTIVDGGGYLVSKRCRGRGRKAFFPWQREKEKEREEKKKGGRRKRRGKKRRGRKKKKNGKVREKTLINEINKLQDKIPMVKDDSLDGHELRFKQLLHHWDSLSKLREAPVFRRHKFGNIIRKNSFVMRFGSILVRLAGDEKKKLLIAYGDAGRAHMAGIGHSSHHIEAIQRYELRFKHERQLFIKCKCGTKSPPFVSDFLPLKATIASSHRLRSVADPTVFPHFQDLLCSDFSFSAVSQFLKESGKSLRLLKELYTFLSRRFRNALPNITCRPLFMVDSKWFFTPSRPPPVVPLNVLEKILDDILSKFSCALDVERREKAIQYLLAFSCQLFLCLRGGDLSNVKFSECHFGISEPYMDFACKSAVVKQSGTNLLSFLPTFLRRNVVLALNNTFELLKKCHSASGHSCEDSILFFEDVEDRRSTFYQSLKRVYKGAAGTDVKPHSLKRTMLGVYRLLGGDEGQLRQLGRHSDSKTTQIYLDRTCAVSGDKEDWLNFLETASESLSSLKIPPLVPLSDLDKKICSLVYPNASPLALSHLCKARVGTLPKIAKRTFMQLFSDTERKVEVRETSEMGKGVFVRGRSVNKNSVLAAYVGKLCCRPRRNPTDEEVARTVGSHVMTLCTYPNLLVRIDGHDYGDVSLSLWETPLTYAAWKNYEVGFCLKTKVAVPAKTFLCEFSGLTCHVGARKILSSEETRSGILPTIAAAQIRSSLRLLGQHQVVSAQLPSVDLIIALAGEMIEISADLSQLSTPGPTLWLPFLWYFARFESAYEQYRARHGTADMYTLIDLDILSIYEDVCHVKLPNPEDMTPEEVRASESTFVEAVSSFFGKLSGLDALYRFEKLVLTEVTEKAVAIYVKQFRKTIRLVAEEERPSPALTKKYFLQGISVDSFRTRVEAALDRVENPDLS